MVQGEFVPDENREAENDEDQVPAHVEKLAEHRSGIVLVDLQKIEHLENEQECPGDRCNQAKSDNEEENE